MSRRGENELWRIDNNKHLNILPKHDWLVMSEMDTTTKTAPRLHFFDPAALADVKAVDMP